MVDEGIDQRQLAKGKERLEEFGENKILDMWVGVDIRDGS